jgi:hypothetical protein
MVSTLPIYIISIAVCLVFLLIAAIVANSIKFQGGSHPKDPAKRKTWFWILGVFATLFNLLFGLFSYYYPQGNNFARSKLINAIGIGSGITFVLYILLGFFLAKIFKHGKIGNWF